MSRGASVQFDDSSVDVSGVENYSGSGGGMGGGGGLAVGGGGLSIVGLLAYLVFGVLGGDGSGSVGLGGVPGGAVNAGVGAESVAELERRCNTEGALDRYTDCRLIKVYNVAEDVWSEEFARRGLSYSQPRLRFFRASRISTACGPAGASTGPFYCPADSGIYFHLGALEQLQRRFGAPGQFAQAYIVAHEFGHHLQSLLQTERAVRRAQAAGGEENAYSVALELQADCYAGVWSTLADRRGEDGIALSQQDVREAITAAQAVGDDAIQSRTQGGVDPESFTHGTSAQRQAWYLRGLQTGDIASCDTFSEAGLPL